MGAIEDLHIFHEQSSANVERNLADEQRYQNKTRKWCINKEVKLSIDSCSFESKNRDYEAIAMVEHQHKLCVVK